MECFDAGEQYESGVDPARRRAWGAGIVVVPTRSVAGCCRGKAGQAFRSRRLIIRGAILSRFLTWHWPKASRSAQSRAFAFYAQGNGEAR